MKPEHLRAASSFTPAAPPTDAVRRATQTIFSRLLKPAASESATPGTPATPAAPATAATPGEIGPPAGSCGCGRAATAATHLKANAASSAAPRANDLLAARLRYQVLTEVTADRERSSRSVLDDRG